MEFPMNLVELIAGHPSPMTRIEAPYVIAEAGVNHEGSMDIARRLIDEAARGGADAIKFQTYNGRYAGFQTFSGVLGHVQGAYSQSVRTFQETRFVLEE